MSKRWHYPFDDDQMRQDTLAEIVSHAISRIEVLKGQDSICVAEEYKEWLGEDFENYVISLPQIKQKL